MAVIFRLKAEQFFTLDKKPERKTVNLNVAANILLSYTILKNARIYHRFKLVYTYDYKRGVYEKVSEKEFITKVKKVLSEIREIELTETTYVDQIYKNIKISRISYGATPEPHIGYMFFTNGLLDFNTGKFSVFNPRIFLLTCVE